MKSEDACRIYVLLSALNDISCWKTTNTKRNCEIIEVLSMFLSDMLNMIIENQYLRPGLAIIYEMMDRYDQLTVVLLFFSFAEKFA